MPSGLLVLRETMTDIVERLRNQEAPCQGGPFTKKEIATSGFCLCSMAAAEIERLREEIEEWKDRCAAERQALEATIDHCNREHSHW
jgi:hypothetical protein